MHVKLPNLAKRSFKCISVGGSQGIPDNAVKHESHTIGLAIVDGEFVLGLVGRNGLIHFDSNDETLKTSTKYYTLTCTPREVEPATKTQCREFLF